MKSYTILETQSLLISLELLIFHQSLMETFYFFHDQGILSASVLSVIPLIRPYQWQSLLMPVWFLSLFSFKVNIFIFLISIHLMVFNNNILFQVLPNDMLEFLDAPVPYIVSIQFLLLVLRIISASSQAMIIYLLIYLLVFWIYLFFKSMLNCLVLALVYM